MKRCHTADEKFFSAELLHGLLKLQLYYLIVMKLKIFKNDFRVDDSLKFTVMTAFIMVFTYIWI